MQYRFFAPAFALFLTLALAPALVAPPQAFAAGGGPSVIADLIGFTSALSGFFGEAIHGMTDAIGYLTGGIQAAGHFQQGTDIVNDMLQNGPPVPPAPPAPPAAGNEPAPAPLPGPAAGGDPAATVPSATGTEQAGAPTAATDVEKAVFRDHLVKYADLSREERKVAGKIKKDPSNEGLKTVLGDLRKAKEEHRNKILFALNYDIETKKYEKLHLLVDYLNTSGDQTVKFFLEIVDETKTKLRFQLVQAQNVGVAVDLEVIEGKLALVMKFTQGAQGK